MLVPTLTVIENILLCDSEQKGFFLKQSAAEEKIRGLADSYGFTDVDGNLPRGPLHQRPPSAG